MIRRKAVLYIRGSKIQTFCPIIIGLENIAGLERAPGGNEGGNLVSG